MIATYMKIKKKRIQVERRSKSPQLVIRRFLSGIHASKVDIYWKDFELNATGFQRWLVPPFLPLLSSIHLLIPIYIYLFIFFSFIYLFFIIHLLSPLLGRVFSLNILRVIYGMPSRFIRHVSPSVSFFSLPFCVPLTFIPYCFFSLSLPLIHHKTNVSVSLTLILTRKNIYPMHFFVNSFEYIKSIFVCIFFFFLMHLHERPRHSDNDIHCIKIYQNKIHVMYENNFNNHHFTFLQSMSHIFFF